MRKGPPLFVNTTVTSCCKYLETEVAAAAVIASHSYPSLSGCPLAFFQRALVAELDVNSHYAPLEAFKLQGMPAWYDNVLIGLLSPANSSWHQQTQSSTSSSKAIQAKGGDDLSSEVSLLQDGSIFLGDLTWSAGKDSNRGAMSVLHKGNVRTLSLEVHLHRSSVCGADVVTKQPLHQHHAGLQGL